MISWRYTLRQYHREVKSRNNKWYHNVIFNAYLTMYSQFYILLELRLCGTFSLVNAVAKFNSLTYHGIRESSDYIRSVVVLADLRLR